jgi:hypothetical protein
MRCDVSDNLMILDQNWIAPLSEEPGQIGLMWWPMFTNRIHMAVKPAAPTGAPKACCRLSNPSTNDE